MVIGKLLSSSRERLVNSLKKFAYRHAWVEAHIKNGIAFQIRAMRKAKEWDQKKLAEMALGNSDLQSMVSRYENPDYGKYSLRTLLDLAKAFDVGLIVRFASFSELIKWEDDLLNTSPAVPAFGDELKRGALSDQQPTRGRTLPVSFPAYASALSGGTGGQQLSETSIFSRQAQTSSQPTALAAAMSSDVRHASLSTRIQ